MFEGIYQSLSMALAIVIFFGLDFLFITYYSKQRTDRGFYWGYTLMGFAAAVGICLQPVVLPILGLHIASIWGLWLQWCGVILIVLSQVLHVWSRRCLKQFYSEGHNIQPGHYVVNSGPYAYVRHPLFSSYIMFALGLVFVNPAVTTAAVLVYVCWDFMHAAIADEILMSENVAGYKDYMKQTARFIPHLRRRFPRPRSVRDGNQ